MQKFKSIGVKLKLTVFIIAGTMMAAFFGCSSHKADIAYPGCDTTGIISLKTDLTPILEVNCFNCHSARNAPVIGGGWNLQQYNIISAFVDINGNGTLIQRIKHDPAISPTLWMPKQGGKLSDCDIEKFVHWAKQGAPDN